MDGRTRAPRGPRWGREGASPAPRTPLERCRDEYLGHLAVERGLSRNTLDAYRRDLNAYVSYLSERGIDEADAVARRDIEGFIAARREAGYASSSINRTLSAVKGMHRFLMREGMSETHPTAGVRYARQDDRLPEYLTIEQATALLDQPFPQTDAGVRDHAILEVLYGCGVRVSELTGLDVGDLYLDDEFLRVRGKGSKERLVPISGTAESALRSYLAAAPPRPRAGVSSPSCAPPNFGLT